MDTWMATEVAYNNGKRDGIAETEEKYSKIVADLTRAADEYKQKYYALKNAGSSRDYFCCPHCGSTEYTEGYFVTGGVYRSLVKKKCICQSCHFSWEVEMC